MAKYDREFLVPYLQDICAFYMADRKLNQKILDQQNQINRLNIVYYPQKPEEAPYLETSIGCLGLGAVMWTFVYVFSFIGLVCMKGPAWACFLCFFAILAGIFVIYGSWKDTRIADATNKRNKAEYEAQMEIYLKKTKLADEEREKKLALIPHAENQLRNIDAERKHVNKLMDQAYSANIIPNQYRNIYAAVFLYDWFSTSGADDLDMALNMFVLEEIKSKLDRILEHQAEIILNQRIMISNQGRMIDNQHQSMEMQREHRRMMQEKLHHIQVTEEERLRYEKMVESNTAATAYFAWANYLK